MITFEVPNLDSESDIPKDFRDLADVFSTLACYADLKAKSLECRKEGRIAKALDHEAAMESYYKNLPDWAQW
jgi:hypothetical protein